MSFNLFGKGFKIDLALFEFGNKPDKIGQVSSKPVESPHDKGVALTKALETSFELWPASIFPAGLFFIDLPTFGALQGVLLKVKGLVFGRDSSVADAHVPNLSKPRTFRTLISR